MEECLAVCQDTLWVEVLRVEENHQKTYRNIVTFLLLMGVPFPMVQCIYLNFQDIANMKSFLRIIHFCSY